MTEPTQHIKISVIICTHNRADVLARSIESLVSQTLDKSLYEIIVVDNASTDGTRSICEAYSSLPNLRYIYEATPGLSVARNTGINISIGEYVAFIDDDAAASPRWLEIIIQTFEQTTPSPDSVGGKIFPMWDIPRPEWFPKDRDTFVTILDYGDESKFIQFPDVLFGTNMSFRRRIVKNLGGFRSELGRKKNKLLSCEESELYQKFAARGYLVRYNPEITVHHQVEARRLTKKWMYKRHYWQGRSEALLLALRANEKKIAGEILFSIELFAKAVKDYCLALSYSNAPQASFRAIADGCFHLGRIVSLLPVYYTPGHEPEKFESVNRVDIMYKVNAVFENQIGFLGFDLSTSLLKAGDQFSITYYWECLKQIEENYSIFIHFTKNGKITFQNDHAMRMKDWQQYDIIRDTQFVSVPENFEGEIELTMGIWYPVENKKLSITEKGSGTPDQYSRLKIDSFTIVVAPK